jgi:hypothetical protein
MRSRGQGVVESLFVLALTLALATLIATTGYLGFAHAWIGYQSDQALFCAAEGEPLNACESTALRNIRKFLPLHKQAVVRLEQPAAQKWTSQVEWRWDQIKLQQNRVLKWDSSLWR